MSGIDMEITQLIPLLVIKLLVAILCGAIIGLEREIKHKTAGIRTMMLICAGSSLFTSISVLIADVSTGIDSTRIIAQIVTGIGFLGAGVIIQTEDKVVGVTTAALIWVVSGIGILTGIGGIISPIVISVIILIFTKLFEILGRFIKIKN